jgi:hypothetical protein
MSLLKKLIVNAITIGLAFGAAVSQTSDIAGCPFDTFGDVNCESEMARLDNLAVNLQNSPTDKAAILFYGGQRFRGRLPKRGEGAARAARLKTYLVERRGLPSSRVIVIDGGYMEEWRAELWLNPPRMSPPQPDRSLTIEKIKFRKGKARAREFRCQI